MASRALRTVEIPLKSKVEAKLKKLEGAKIDDEVLIGYYTSLCRFTGRRHSLAENGQKVSD